MIDRKRAGAALLCGPPAGTVADAFHTANPNITVKITQTAWAQYWQNPAPAEALTKANQQVNGLFG